MTGPTVDGERPLLVAVRYPGDPEWTPARAAIGPDHRDLDLDRSALRPTGDGFAVALAPGRDGVAAVPFAVPAPGAPPRVARSKVRHLERFELTRSPLSALAIPGPSGKPPRLVLHDVAIRQVEGTTLRLDPGRAKLDGGVAVLQIGAGDDPLPLLVELVSCGRDGTVDARLAESSAEVVQALAEQLVHLVLRGLARPVTGG